jgi:NAD(P)-dependent dehydrogenase (short-subunit alcohol dehydrogenase family)
VPRHAGKRAVVTGAARGIGLATARRLQSEGAEVLGVDLNKPATIVVDLRTKEGREKVVREAEEIDYLVNAAGVIELTPIWDVDEKQWANIMGVNAEALFFLTQQLAPRVRGGGAIVNLSSAGAKIGVPEGAVYAASKAAVISLTRSFAFALASRNVRVNAICPGIVDTPMQSAVTTSMAEIRGQSVDESMALRLKGIPLGRIATADEVAGVISFLLSDESSYLTGQAINMTGGMVTW